MNRTPGALVLALLLVGAAAQARRTAPVPPPTPLVESLTRGGDGTFGDLRRLAAAASTETTWLYSTGFESGGSCSPEGWTAVDNTAQIGTYFHVDDYAGLAFGPLAGSKSLWCGARPAGGPVYCQYASLPGYGHAWDQGWCTKDCIAVSGDLDVSFLLSLDTEAEWDFATLEFTDCAGGDWTPLAGGANVWDGDRDSTVSVAYPLGGATSVKVRIRFQSDGAWDDQDGLFNTDGAVHIDNLQVEGLALEDFEDEAAGATASNDWQACVQPGYGITAILMPGSGMVQQDPCVSDLSCVWAFIAGSTANYACGGFPAQTAVPYKNADGQYMDNDIWSPMIPLTGTGNGLTLEFSVYRDLPLDNLVFYNWAVRTLVNDCPTNWKRRTSTYYGGNKDWHRSVQSVGDLVNLATATHVQVRLEAFDMCEAWCGVTGSGACHSHAPLFDNVAVYRVATLGPQWNVRDIDTFQDSFANDGTLTGTVRADMANDVLPSSNPGIIPGDSSVAIVADPVAGLATDGVVGGKAVYAYVAVWPQGQANKTGAHLSGGARWPHVATEVIGGVSWTKLRFDQAYTSGGSPVSNTYCIDLNDALFTPGDTVCFFYGAKSNDGAGSMTFYSRDIGTVDDIAMAAANPMEFTCLPAGGTVQGDILYVDGMDGRGAQPYWDTAFQSLGILGAVDRYDVRSPSSTGIDNRPDSRIRNVPVQLAGVYRVILWDCGDLSVTLGGGSGSPLKTDDYGMVNAFLSGLTSPGGVYIGGDDVSEQLNLYASPSAVAFQSTYMAHNLVSGNHRLAFGVAPAAVRNPALCFDDDFVAFGGCPLLNDFDVMAPVGAAMAAFTYGAAAGNNAAVVFQATNTGTTDVRVLLSGFSFAYIADDESDGVSDRAAYLGGVLCALGSTVNQPTGAPPAPATRLAQNYPNPFNPGTTIPFTLRARGHVVLAVYDVGGARVRTLVDESRAAGAHTAAWDGRDDAGAAVASGVYFCRLVAGDYSATRKLVLLK